MSAPDLDNGYTRIANELLEAIIQGEFNKREYKILFSVVRKTYGFNKKIDQISLSQLAQLTGINRADVSRTLKNLEQRLIIITKVIHRGKLIGLNKNYDQWLTNEQLKGDKVLSKHQQPTGGGVGKTPTKLLVKHQPSCWQNTNQVVGKTPTTKDTIKNKERQYKNNTTHFEKSFDAFWSVWPKKVQRQAALKAWLKIKPDQTLTNTIIEAVERTKFLKWDHGEKKYIPNPATYLNGERWNDEIFDERPKPKKCLSAVDRVAEYNREADERERREREKIINPYAGALIDVTH